MNEFGLSQPRDSSRLLNETKETKFWVRDEIHSSLLQGNRF